MSEFPLEAEKAIDSFNGLIEHMKRFGWNELPDGFVVNDNYPQVEYENWELAIQACIEIASGS